MSPELRIGDAERERATTALAEHYAAGRLDQEEHGERLDRVWAARTLSDLDPVFADLPGPTPGRAPRDSRRSQPVRPATRRGRPRVPGPLLVLLVVLVAVTVMMHLPLVLVGLGVWFFFFRTGACRR